MKKLSTLSLAMASVATIASSAQTFATTTPDAAENLSIPERAIILSGSRDSVHPSVVAVLYDTSDFHFQDPETPRFLLIDRKGSTVFGIGGYVEGVARYDFDGAIDKFGFDTYAIPVPADPELRSQFSADVTHTNLVMQLATDTRWGVFSAYVQANFSNPKYGFKLKQAYVRLHNVTAGLTRSTFQDALSGVPTIDYEGPSGAISAKNVMLQYKAPFGKGFSAAISAEMPRVTYTTGADNKEISQRVPDIPAYIQYQWDGGRSHVRASAIFRDLSYRNLISKKNEFVAGWGVQLSGAIRCTKYATVFYQAAYGKGIGNYVNDLNGYGFDLITDADGATMKAPGSLGIVGGIRINPCKKVFMSASYSMCRLYDQENLAPDTYRRGNYAVVNCFYNPTSDVQVGIEYLHGRRTDMDGSYGNANRIQAMLKYSF